MPAPPALPPPDDGALVAAFQQGDEFAYVTLYNRYKAPVFAFCAKMLLDRAAAEDALQETFVRVYEHRDRLARGAFRSWLFTIARNHCLNVLRKAKWTEPLPEHADPPAPSTQTPFDELLRSERMALVTAYLGQLSPEYREVLVLREYQNLSYDEIAAVTRSTVSAVKSRLFKARRKLAEHLQPWLGDGADAPVSATRPAGAPLAPASSPAVR